jgi:hypothetical protein
MNIPEIFKYNTLISVPLFAIISLWLIQRVPDFSFSQHTVSKSVLLFKNSKQELIFRLNFLIKALLDLGFVWYLIHYFKLSIFSPLPLLLIPSALLFGSLAYFVEGKQTLIHQINAMGSGVLWALGQFCLSRSIGNTFFIQFTNVMVTIPILLAFGFMFAKKTNVFVQILCMSFWYIWLFVLVFRYL